MSETTHKIAVSARDFELLTIEKERLEAKEGRTFNYTDVLHFLIARHLGHHRPATGGGHRTHSTDTD